MLIKILIGIAVLLIVLILSVATRPSRFRIARQATMFAATHTAEFAFQPQGDQTLVIWSMEGKNNFMSKAFGLIVNMDKLIGGDFENGLSQMKSVAEADSKQRT